MPTRPTKNGNRGCLPRRNALGGLKDYHNEREDILPWNFSWHLTYVYLLHLYFFVSITLTITFITRLLRDHNVIIARRVYSTLDYEKYYPLVIAVAKEQYFKTLYRSIWLIVRGKIVKMFYFKNNNRRNAISRVGDKSGGPSKRCWGVGASQHVRLFRWSVVEPDNLEPDGGVRKSRSFLIVRSRRFLFSKFSFRCS